MTTSVPEVLFFVDSPFNNGTSCLKDVQPRINPGYEVVFWLMAIVCTSIVAIGAILNSLVILFAKENPLKGGLRHLNVVVKHLAVSDAMYGFLACPFLLTRFNLGKVSAYSE